MYKIIISIRRRLFEIQERQKTTPSKIGGNYQITPTNAVLRREVNAS
jgi:hypothetical protein